LFAPNGEIYFVGGGRGNMHLQKIGEDGAGPQNVMAEKADFLYDISPDGKWLALWVGDAIDVYPSGGGALTKLCSACAGAGAEDRGVTPPLVSWSRDGKELYLYSEGSFQTYAVPLKPGQVLPEMSESRISWRAAPPTVPGARLIPHRRPFMSNSSVYAYPELSAHRNIYRIPIP